MAGGPSAADHYQQGQENFRFYSSLGGSKAQFPQWAMTALFYTTVHECQAALIAKGQRPRDHTMRKAALRKAHKPLASIYEALYDRSRQARYECFAHSSNDLVLAESLVNMARVEIQAFSPPPY